MADLKYSQPLLKVSGEAFCNAGGFGVDAEAVGNLAETIKGM